MNPQLDEKKQKQLARKLKISTGVCSRSTKEMKFYISEKDKHLAKMQVRFIFSRARVLGVCVCARARMMVVARKNNTAHGLKKIVFAR